MTNNSMKIPTWFWVVSAVALLWNLIGLMAFYTDMTITPEALAALPDAERALYDAMPTWANIAYGVATIGGTLGCIALLLRKAWAIPILIASLVGVIVQLIHSLFFSNAMEVFGTGPFILSGLVLVIGIFLVWFARHAATKKWIA